MSKTNNFVNKYIGKSVTVPWTQSQIKEGYKPFAGECVSLVQRFIIEEINAIPKARGNGEAWRTVLINEGLGTRVPRSEARIGDIISWGGKYGHVAIVLSGDEIFESVGRSVGGSGIAKIGSADYWDKKQGMGLVTRLKDFVDEIPSKDKPAVQGIKKGDTVQIKDNANKYATGQTIPKIYKGKNDKVVEIAGDKVLLKNVYSWVYAKDLVQGQTVAPKPIAPKPQPQFKRVKFGGKVRLFVNSTGNATFPAPSVNKYTNVKSRTVNVIDRKNGRTLVRVPTFRPTDVWLNDSDVKGV